MSTRWGPWRLVEFGADDAPIESLNGRYLIHDVTRFYGYPVDLDRFRTHADLGFWVEHLAGKDWCTPVSLRALVDAYSELNEPVAGVA